MIGVVRHGKKSIGGNCVEGPVYYLSILQ